MTGQANTPHIANRDKIIRDLREELVGPSPQGKEIDCTGEIVLDDPNEAFLPWCQMGSGEEILKAPPSTRYGIGVLYPVETVLEDEAVDGDLAVIPEADSANIEGDATDAPGGGIQEPANSARGQTTEEADGDPDSLSLSTANSHRPSTMAVSFLAEFPEGSRLKVEVRAGRYHRKQVRVLGKEHTWWLRSPVLVSMEFKAEDVRSLASRRPRPVRSESHGADGLKPDVEVFVRPSHDETRLVTVCLINRMDTTTDYHERCLFQSHLRVAVTAPDGGPHVLPYPRRYSDSLDAEEQSLALLYSKSETFAIGHGCAADWGTDDGHTRRTSWVSAESLPVVEIPSVTADITRKDGSPLSISMAQLAGLEPGQDGFDALSELIDRYADWVKDKRSEIHELDAVHRSAAEVHMQHCDECVDRMRAGLVYLQRNQEARRAFELANHAVLLQQICGQNEKREIRYVPESVSFSFSREHQPLQPLKPPAGLGYWRAFQIAFLLMTIESSAEGSSPFHDTVELIWFPTGGGKTEAYLGLAAFVAFLGRLRNPHDSGVTILTRYTLRLLTAQQFLRTAGLVCAMEFIRRQTPKICDGEEFSIGMWLGGDVTPNNRAKALENMRALNKGDKYANNLFVLTQCPWCGAQMGPIKHKAKVPRAVPRAVGYEQHGNTVVFRCPDKTGCAFGSHLPVYVVDEDIYERRPTFVVGTVDKFARLAWNPAARAIFGIAEDGSRMCSPPRLIIQDELHLISGPLGSMVGLYETVVEELCTDRRSGSKVKPKIVSSTATIRRYSHQVKALYNRDSVCLFPPPGLDAGDSFFAKHARNPDDSLMRGKIYVGIDAPGLGSLQTAQVRAIASLVQSPMPLSVEERDPWWTLVVFFNSLRELGNTLSLFQSDIPRRLDQLRDRFGTHRSEMRQLGPEPMELTGRKGSEEIHKAIPLLEVGCGSTHGRPVDVCLASSIVEVGIDIDRLSLMTVVGQPKSTSQYIQVTGRVGRKWKERPGLVVTIYSPARPRDRSHFEQFRSYHERLYAQVEPSSVTPFSFPALERALHAVMVAYVRQLGPKNVADTPYPCPDEWLDRVYEILMARIQEVDSEETDGFKRLFHQRVSEWRRWERTRWTNTKWNDTNAPLLTRAGSYVDPAWERISWRTPESLRNVDAECQMEVSTLYLSDVEDLDA